jgi:hypothetical protein
MLPKRLSEYRPAMENESFEGKKWREEKAREDAQRAEDKFHEKALKISDAAMQSGQVAIRTAALVNGGAAVSVLAFLGGLVGQGKVRLDYINTVAGSLMWFVGGVAAAVCSLGSAYIVNYCARWELDSMSHIAEYPFTIETASSKRWKHATVFFQLIALFIGILSLLLFVVGMWYLKQSIGSMKAA